MSASYHDSTKPPSHADDWLITYADMITLLLCFFVLFLVMSIAKKQVLPPVEPPKIVAKTDVEVLPPQILLPDVFKNIPPRYEDEMEEEVAQKQLVLPPVIEARPTPQKMAKAEPKGDRITILEIDSSAFFDRGSATLSGSGRTLLQDVVGKLKSDEFRDYQITVEGHTDDTPINTAQFPSNWELSTARASAVARFLLDQGIAATKLRASGYADTFPKVPNHDADGNVLPHNQAQNRRVVIKLEKIEKAE
ncbi:MAG: OmpA family protein [Bdellovibrionales bacterium]